LDKTLSDSITVQNPYKDTTKMTILFGFNQIFLNILTPLIVVYEICIKKLAGKCIGAWFQVYLG